MCRSNGFSFFTRQNVHVCKSGAPQNLCVPERSRLALDAQFVQACYTLTKNASFIEDSTENTNIKEASLIQQIFVDLLESQAIHIVRLLSMKI